MGTGARADRRTWLVYVIAGTVATAVYMQLRPVSGALLYEGVGLSSVAAVLIGIRLHEPENPLPWYLLATGLAMLTIGDSIFNANDLVFDISPFPSIADVAYLGAYPFLAASLVLLVRQRLPGQDTGSLVDALIIGVGTGVASWVFLMEPYAANHGMSLVQQVVSIAYPAADVVLLVVLARLLLAPGSRPASYLLLFGGFALTMVADTAFAWISLNGTYKSPEPTDALFLLSYLLLGAAALHPSMVDLERRERARVHTGLWRFIPLGVAAMTPAAFLAGQTASGGHIDNAGVIIAGAVLIPLLALTRIGLLMRELAHYAGVDPLTSLPNRSLLFDRIGEALDRSRRTGTYVAVLYVDVDRFKLVNDSHGHAVGDELLVAVSERLREAVRHGDTVARVGGDEFVVLCENLNGHAAALSAADRMSLALVDPVVVAAGMFSVSLSIGIAVGSGAELPDDLLNDADAAMYRAKERGRGRAAAFDLSMRHPTAAGSTRLDDDLRRAVERDELRLYLQPEIDLASGELIGVEALLRWQHPEWGTLPPATVLPIAEETGLILPIGEWVLDEACRLARGLLDTGTNIEMTVNLSLRQLVEPGIAVKVERALARRSIAPDRFVVDVRDSALAADDERAVSALRALRKLGVHVTIDDFAPDAAPIGVLQSLSADRIKLDRSLVVATTGEDDDQTVLAAMISLARDLGMRVCAEGVETRSQRRALARLGCHSGLGHLWAPPLPTGAVLDQVLGRESHAQLRP